MQERLSKRLQKLGIASRREAEKMILSGRIAVDGQTVTTPVFFVTEDSEIGVDGEPVTGGAPHTRLWIYHKPRGLLCTSDDPQGRPTIYDQIYEDPAMPHVISIGRLDLNSEGLLLLTNASSLAHKAERPENGWKRCYKVRVYGEIPPDLFVKAREGLTIDGIHYRPVDIDPVDGGKHTKSGRNNWIFMTLQEGKNREIRRILEYFGLEVSRLIRLSYGPFELGDCPAGHIREVTLPKGV